MYNEVIDASKDEMVKSELRGLFERRGFGKVRVNQFEEYELYLENKNFLNSENIITFMDAGGKLMALKPDVTLSIVKNCSSKRFVCSEKLYYTDEVCRLTKDTREYKMFGQVGVEIIGPEDPFTNIEILDLALESLSIISGEFILDISHQGFVSALLGGMDLSYAFKRDIMSALHTKSRHMISSLLEDSGLPEDAKLDILSLADISGGISDTLPMARELVRSKQMEEAWQELRDIGDMLETRGLSGNVNLDFSVVNDFDYYNGLTFLGYIKGVPDVVLTGGRYDNLMKKMGKKNGAIGFAMFLSELNTYFKRGRDYDFDILLTYGDCDYAKLLDELKALTNTGKSVRLERSVPPGLKFLERFHFGKDGLERADESNGGVENA